MSHLWKILLSLLLTNCAWVTSINVSSVFNTNFISADGNFCVDNFGCFNHTGTLDFLDSFRRRRSVDVSIYLTTQKDGLNNSHQMDLNNIGSLENSNFNFDRETKFIIPGWQSKKNSTWIREMVKELLVHDDYNVFVVNWAEYFINIVYSIAAADTKIVGDKVAQFIHQLQSKYGYPLNKIHLIGHSLGAHICGFAGSKLDGQLKRITGLDPAGPLFVGRKPNERLDPNDATFVDVIHTNAGSIIKNKHFGILDHSGHVDFFPNGGWSQPGCVVAQNSFLNLISTLRSSQKTVFDMVGCNHRMAIDYFIESINSDCNFHSKQCLDFDAFLNLKCDDPCDNSTCLNMGFHATWHLHHSAHQSFFLITDQVQPYCIPTNHDHTLNNI